MDEELVKEPDVIVLYRCNRQRCEKCYSECTMTSDINYAADFEMDYADNEQIIYIQKED